jgi:hypothetical protein
MYRKTWRAWRNCWKVRVDGPATIKKVSRNGARHSPATCGEKARPGWFGLLLRFQHARDDAHSPVIVAVGKKGQLGIRNVNNHVNRSDL